MTNETIPNVPRELLERASNLAFQTQHYPLHEELRALLSAPSPAGVDGLEALAWHHFGDRTKLLCALGKERGIPGGYTDEFTQPLCRLSDAQAIIDGLRGEVADLHTTMMAAAVEIQEHWAAHCDEEGYGPANLMHRLERGIASQYGYSAETLVRLESQRDQQAKRIGELELALNAIADCTSDGTARDCAMLALSAGKDSDQ